MVTTTMKLRQRHRKNICYKLPAKHIYSHSLSKSLNAVPNIFPDALASIESICSSMFLSWSWSSAMERTSAPFFSSKSGLSDLITSTNSWSSSPFIVTVKFITVTCMWREMVLWVDRVTDVWVKWHINVRMEMKMETDDWPIEKIGRRKITDQRKRMVIMCMYAWITAQGVAYDGLLCCVLKRII